MGTWRLIFTYFFQMNWYWNYLHDNYWPSDKKNVTSEKFTLWTQKPYQIKPLWYSWFDKQIRPISSTEKSYVFFIVGIFPDFVDFWTFFTNILYGKISFFVFFSSESDSTWKISQKNGIICHMFYCVKLTQNVTNL